MDADILYKKGNYKEALKLYTTSESTAANRREVLYKIGACKIKIGGFPDSEIIESMVGAYMMDPDYLEPVGDLIIYLNKNKKYEAAYLIGRMVKSFRLPFIPRHPLTREYYEYKLELEIGIAAFYAKVDASSPDGCFERMEALLQRKLPAHIKLCCEDNQAFELTKRMAVAEVYPQKRISEIMNNSIKTNIVLTITSCKRLALFKRTINSFINCCDDFRLINKWICIDDNSSDADREEMLRLYPFFKFTYKTPEEKGHIASLNKLVDMVVGDADIDYVLHIEDDWTWVKNKNYITDALSILESDAHVGQVLINRNYSQDIDHLNHTIRGGTEQVSQFGHTPYIKHVYHPVNSPAHAEYNKTLGYNPNNTYWPHYSLRPSLTRARVFRELGHFDDFYGHFENIYGLRYIEAGYYSAFFPGIYCIHTGPKSGSGTNIPNSYILNGEAQFSWRAPDPPEIDGFKFIPGKDIIGGASLDNAAPTLKDLVALANDVKVKVISTDGRYLTVFTNNYVTIYNPNKNFPYKTGIYVRRPTNNDAFYHRYLTERWSNSVAEQAALECFHNLHFYGAALRICKSLINNCDETDIRLLKNREFMVDALNKRTLDEIVEYKQPKNLLGVAHDLLADITHDAYFIHTRDHTVSDIKHEYIRFNDFYPDWKIILLPQGMVLNKGGALEVVKYKISNRDQIYDSPIKVVNAVI